MTGRVQHLQRNLAYLKLLSIFGKVYGELCFCIGPVYNRRFGSSCQIQMTGNKVCVKMGLKNILNGNVMLFGKVQVSVNIAYRVYHSGFSSGGNEIRRFRKTISV